MFWIFSLILGFVCSLKIYNKWTLGWCKSQTCLVGKTAIVTGANTGIGYETALDFAKRGARVILACRDEKKAKKACDKIIEETGNENVVVRLIDMSSFKSVRAFAKQIHLTEDRLDILVNNAGAAFMHDKTTEDGLTFLMQVNYFSPFLLTLLLIGVLKKGKRSRIVNVSSLLAKHARHFQVEKVDKFSGYFQSYNDSKLCNILFTIELAKKLDSTDITTYSLHPGAVKTDIIRDLNPLVKGVMTVLMNLFYKTSEEGAQTTIYCSVANGIEKYNGEHFEDCRQVVRYKTAADPSLPKKLWEKTLDIVHLSPDELHF